MDESEDVQEVRGEVDELRRCIDAAIRERNESVESSWSGAQLECVIQAAHKLAKTVREVLLRLQPSPAFFLQAVREVTRIVPVRAAHFDRGAVVRSQPPLPVPELAGHILLLPIRGSNSSRRATCHSVLQPIIDALWKGLGSYAPPAKHGDASDADAGATECELLLASFASAVEETLGRLDAATILLQGEVATACSEANLDGPAFPRTADATHNSSLADSKAGLRQVVGESNSDAFDLATAWKMVVAHRDQDPIYLVAEALKR
jgi:hypothetical protein